MHCIACDTANDDGARYCRVCGTPLAQAGAGAAPQTGATRTLAPAAPRCPACGRDNPQGALYCVYCATRLDTAPVFAGALGPAAAYAAPVNSTVWTFAAGDPLQLMLRAVWFVLVGWWLGLIWTLLAWLFNLTLIGLPLGVMMLNAIPQVMTLRPGRRVAPSSGLARYPDHPFALRALWFLLIGWWASLLWMLVAWGLSATLLLLPLGFWMFDRVPTITTLAQEP